MKQLFFKVLSVLVLILTILPLSAQTIWDGTADTKLVGSGTQEDPYTISTAKQLAGLAKRVNKGYNYEGVYFKLTNDILLNDTTNWQEWTKENGPANIWTPIGGSSASFCGTFDGNNHIIAGLYINNGSYLGLFGYASRATFSNIGFKAVCIYGSSSIGALGGCIGGHVKNCYATGRVSGDYKIGGLVGALYNYLPEGENYKETKGELFNSYFKGTVSGKQVGGLVGRSDGRIYNSCFIGDVVGMASHIDDNYGYRHRDIGVGGLVGYNTGTISQTYAKGTVTAENDFCVGGLVGYTDHCLADHNGDDNIYNCWTENEVIGFSHIGGLIGYVDSCYTKGNSSDFPPISHCYTLGNVKGNKIVGGLVGHMSESVGVTYCYTVGNVTGDSVVGGLIGQDIYSDYYNPDINYSFTLGDVQGNVSVGGIVGDNTIPINTCYATGNIQGNINIGGIAGSTHNECREVDEWENCIGYQAKSYTNDCYCTGQITAIDYGSGCQGDYYDIETTTLPANGYGAKSTKEMKTKNTFNFDFIDTWGRRDDINNGYPYLRWAHETRMPDDFEMKYIPWSGRGTEDSPYLIQNIEDLRALKESVSYKETMEGLYFKQTADILINDTINWQDWDEFYDNMNQWQAISIFCGTYDGDGHIIAGLYNDNLNGNVAVFGTLRHGACVKNLGIKASKLYGCSAPLIGTINGNNIQVSNCYVYADIIENGSVGGLINYISSSSFASISCCFFDGNISTTGDNVGGLIGCVGNSDKCTRDDVFTGDVSITECYTNGKIIGGNNVGGLIGGCYFGEKEIGNIKNCYTISSTEGTSYIGALVGKNGYYKKNAHWHNNSYSIDLDGVSISMSYAVATDGKYKGLISTSSRSYDASGFYDTGTTIPSYYYSGTPKTTIQMKQKATYTDWDFISVWGRRNDINNGYPYLRCGTNLPDDEEYIAVNSVSLNETILLLNGGETFQLVSTVSPFNASNHKVTWESSYPTVASIDNKGLVTGLTAGETTITVTTEDGKHTATCKVTVEIAVTSLQLDVTKLSMKIGKTDYIDVIITPSNADVNALVWSSSDEDVATVSKGLVTAHNIGKTTIKVATADNSHFATCEVTVSEETPVTGITLTPQSVEMSVGTVQQLTASVIPANATNQTIHWQSGNATVASVDDTGLITAENAGSTIILATTEEGNYATYCMVTVKNKEDTPTDLDYTQSEEGAVCKVFENGTIYIIRNGEKYTIDGRKVM